MQDAVLTQMLTHFFVGGIVGSYLLSWLWGQYGTAITGNDLEDGVSNAARSVTGLDWGLYVSITC